LGGTLPDEAAKAFFLLAFLLGADCIIHNDSIANKLWDGSASVEHKALLQLGVQDIHETVLLLLVDVNPLWSILCEVVKQLGVDMH
jgi:hypothetical protein